MKRKNTEEMLGCVAGYCRGWGAEGLGKALGAVLGAGFAGDCRSQLVQC